MKRGVLIGGAAVLLAGAAAIVLMLRPASVDLLLVNGRVITLDAHLPAAEAVAVRSSRIVAVGTTADLRARYVAAREIDLQGRAVVPGLIDAHGHVEGLGTALAHLRFEGMRTPEDIGAAVRDEADRRPPGEWIRGRGWDQNLWPDKSFPTRALLDQAAPRHPVYLVRVDGHAAWVNSETLRRAGITASTPDPEGGRILRDAAGEPTGVFVDNAVDLLLSALPTPGVEERERLMVRALNECAALGLTEVHDMGVDSAGMEIYRRLAAGGRLPLRVFVAADGIGSGWRSALTHGPESGLFDGFLSIRAVKFYADGALGSRGAALIDPYADDPGNRGLTLTSAETLKAAVQACLEKGFQACTHAIGDRANTIVLSVYENVFSANGINGLDRRFRVEHAQVLDPGDIGRFHRLGVIPSMQPIHCTSDMRWAVDRLGPVRIAGAYAWHSLLAEGSIVPAGSDFPVEDPNPMLGFHAAVTRQSADGLPAGGWQPEQRMTREEALKAYTVWGAYAAFQEDRKGTLAEGAWADLTVLSDDIMTIAADRIPGVRAEMTIVGGRIVHVVPALADRGGRP